jgi:hypothetical protein
MWTLGILSDKSTILSILPQCGKYKFFLLACDLVLLTIKRCQKATITNQRIGLPILNQRLNKELFLFGLGSVDISFLSRK